MIHKLSVKTRESEDVLLIETYQKLLQKLNKN